jgi:hypothetical protein
MQNKLAWLVVTLVLGALGSGLWELAFRPFLAYLGTAALDVVTLGLESLRNGLYEEAARGQYERVSIAILSAGAGIMAGITTVVLFLPAFRRKVQKERESGTSGKPFRAALVLLFATTMALLLFQRIAYVNRAANYYEQLATIAAPYLTETQRLQVRSQFAQVTTRAQYVALIEQLRTAALSNRAHAPEFTIY